MYQLVELQSTLINLVAQEVFMKILG